MLLDAITGGLNVVINHGLDKDYVKFCQPKNMPGYILAQSQEVLEEAVAHQVRANELLMAGKLLNGREEWF